LTTKQSIRVADLLKLLAPALGDAKADEVVRATQEKLACSGDELSYPQLMSVLEQIATTAGIVGVAARFVKSRLILSLGSIPPR
jgi:hypothetical protein